MNSIDSRPRNHYDVLEVSHGASPEVLRAAYKSLIQRYHPDRNPGDAAAAERSALVVKAYQVLSDPVARSVYDRDLKRQSDSIERVGVRRRELPLSAVSQGKELHWLSWAPIVLLVLFLWFFWSAFFDAPPVSLGPKTIASPHDLPTGRDDNVPLSARTVPVLIENLEVNLVPPGIPASATSRDTKRVLSIRTIGVVAGGFDPDKYIELLNSSREYITRKLSERLATADYERLVRQDGDRYLKRLILDSIGDITNTKRLERDAPTGTNPATHYGLVEVLLPDAFVVESR